MVSVSTVSEMASGLIIFSLTQKKLQRFLAFWTFETGTSKHLAKPVMRLHASTVFCHLFSVNC
jgi:hypothetical protein